MKCTINVLFCLVVLLLPACDIIQDFDAVPGTTDQTKKYHTTPNNAVLMDFASLLTTTEKVLTFPELKHGELIYSQIFGKSFIQYQPFDSFTSGEETFELGNKKVTIVMHQDLKGICEAGAQQDKITMKKGESVSLDLLINDQYCNKPEELKLSLVSGTPRNGTAVLKDGKLNYSPNPGFTGTDVVFYQLKDGGLTSSAMIYLYVELDAACSFNINADQAFAQKGQSVSIDVTANDQLCGYVSQPLRISKLPSFGTLSIKEGKIVYTAGANFKDTDTFEYKIADTPYKSTGLVKVSLQ
jgi:hypothetical protein